jgi:hypothetical protein
MADNRWPKQVLEGEQDRELGGSKESRMHWQRQAWNEDDGLVDKNGDWESEAVSDVNKAIHTL